MLSSHPHGQNTQGRGISSGERRARCMWVQNQAMAEKNALGSFLHAKQFLREHLSCSLSLPAYIMISHVTSNPGCPAQVPQTR
jgi:hypothetical protein